MNNFADFKQPTQEEISIDLESQFRGAVRLYLEALLEEEMTNLIGAENPNDFSVEKVFATVRFFERFSQASGKST